MGSEARTTRHHHTNCAIHGTLVNGKLRDCTCTAAATPPTPPEQGDREFSICVWCNARVEWMASADRAEAEAKLREHSATCREHPAVKTLALARATPPTPDLDAVREALVRAIKVLAQSVKGVEARLDLETATGELNGISAEALADALLRPAPLPADAERDAREAAWFRWLRDNPQAAAFTAVNVAKWVPAGPDLGATMASGTVVGEMEDAKNPDYRYHIAASSLPADVQEVVAQVTVTAKWMRGRIITSTDVPSLCVSGDEFADGIDTLLAHLTREAR